MLYSAHVHEEAFRDSPHERQIYEIGLQVGLFQWLMQAADGADSY